VIVRYAGSDRELTVMRWGMPPPKLGGQVRTESRSSSDPRVSDDGTERDR
jgi:hypothetical protein